MHKTKLKQISLMVCLALMPLVVNAAGLGKLTAMSGLGEPLNAEIELLSVSPEEMSSLTAAIAPEEAYAVQGVERTSLHNAIKVDVAKRADGTPFLKLSTREPVSDPFIDMLVQVDWSTGRLLREFTVLLDPPGYNSNVTSSVTEPSETVKSTGSAVKAPAAETKKKKQVRSGKIAAPAAVDSPDEYKTKRGDTLTRVAKEMQLEGVSLEQMLVGIYQTNKEAFVGNNMNQLKVGQIIKKPSSEEVSQITQSEAKQEIRVHSKDWNAYKNKLAGTVSESPAGAEDASLRSSSGKISAPAEDKATPPIQGPRDVVKLSKSDTAQAKAEPTDAGDKAMREKMNTLQEEVTASTQRVKEANDRVAALEKQIQDMQKLLEMKNQAMANLQRQAEEQSANKAKEAEPAPVAQVEPPKVEAPVAEPPKPAEAKPATEAPKGEAAIEPVKKKKMVVTPPSQPVEEPSLFADPMLLGLGGALALLFGGWFYFRNKRKRSLDSFEQGILTSGGLKVNTVFGNTAGGTVDTGNTSFLTDFSHSTSGVIDTHDVDPIAEAEVYMAYGREAQAEEILKDAIAKDPKRHELHLKLFEIFAGRNDATAFETVAGEMYATLGSADPTWHRVAEMGRKLEPNNPLYATESTASHTGESASAGLSQSNLGDFSGNDVTSTSGLDFPLDIADKTETSEPVKKDDQDDSLDFDLGDFGNTVTEPDNDFANVIEPGEDLVAGIVPNESVLTQTQENDLSELSYKGNEMAFELDSSDSSMGSLETKDLDQPQSNVAELQPQGFGYTMPNLDISGFNASETGTNLHSESESPSIKMGSEEAVFDITEPEPVALDFNLNIPEIKSDDTPAKIEPSISEVPEIDLSGISLDLNAEAADVADNFTFPGDEPESVNTKLDLVAAYLDMDDKEGARELLEEVMKEGGEKQRERAQQLLNTLA